MPHEEARLPYTPKAGIVTVSSSRFEAYLKGLEYSDESGDLAEELLRRAGIEKIYRFLIGDRPHQLEYVLDEAWRNGLELLLFIGGTGVSPSDNTYRILSRHILDRLEGFQDIYNYLSYKDIGVRAISSRLIAGWYKDILIFTMPGSRNAVKEIIEKIILKEYIHLLWLRKYGKI